ncbi:MAG: PAS domain S-box protein [Ferruginibacter sp.]|nr:PAS domain S-box protein [Ferruginibacter sp.]
MPQPNDQKFEALFQYASMGILVANKEGIITMVNRFLIKEFGYTNPSELIGKKVEVLIPHRFSKHHDSYREKYNNELSPRAMGMGRELHGLKKDKTEIPVEVSLSHYTFEGEKFIIAYVIDITQRKEIENNALQQKEQLARINKKMEELNEELEKKVELRTEQLKEIMQQLKTSRDELSSELDKEKELSDLKTRFVSMASHEFRTPLSTILSSASLLAKYTTEGEQPQRDKHIARIKSSVNNLTSILNEFLSIGRIDDGRIEPQATTFDVQEMVSGICTEMQMLSTQNQQITYKHLGQTMVYLDPNLFRNIIINLLSNAIKFSHPGGKIELNTTVQERELSVVIRDYGIGIAAQDQKRLFKRFFRARNAVNIQGTGLGLHIVGKYLELMNGKITFNSNLGEGTIFNIVIPVNYI